MTSGRGLIMLAGLAIASSAAFEQFSFRFGAGLS